MEIMLLLFSCWVLLQNLGTPWTAACHILLSFTNALLKLMSIEPVMPSNHVMLYCPLLLPSIFPSTRVFSNDSALCIMWSKYLSFSISINPSNEFSGLISFRMDWLDLLAVHKTLKSLLQHHSLKALILWCSTFFKVQLLHPYMPTGKKTKLWLHRPLSAKWCQCFLMSNVITFLPRSKSLLFHGCSHNDFEAQEN